MYDRHPVVHNSSVGVLVHFEYILLLGQHQRGDEVLHVSSVRRDSHHQAVLRAQKFGRNMELYTVNVRQVFVVRASQQTDIRDGPVEIAIVLRAHHVPVGVPRRVLDIVSVHGQKLLRRSQCRQCGVPLPLQRVELLIPGDR